MSVERSGSDGVGAQSVPAETASHASTSRGVSRRALLRTTATAVVPTILTLQSGAALAKSSNLMGTVSHANRAIGANGRVQCLDGAGVVGGTYGSRIDIGKDPMLHVQYVTQREYFRPNQYGSSGDTSRPVSIETMCREGGVYWYKDASGWSQVWQSTTPGIRSRGIEKGFMVSATALSSFSGAIKVKTTF